MIELKHISKSFGTKTVLNNLNMTVYPDEVTFIVGTSGSGKTTLLNIIGGLSLPDSGDLIVDGQNIQEDLNKYRADCVGFIFQDFNLVSGLSVKDNVLLGQYLSGRKSKVGDAEVPELLRGLGLDQPEQKAETLSGGEKQRTAFARSMLKNSRVIIADEPTGNLDSENAEKVLDILAQNKSGRYIIVVSHDMEKARKYADRIVEISDGNIINDSRADNSCTDEIAAEAVIHASAPTRINAVRMLGQNSVRRRLGKILSTVLVIALSISALTMVFTMRSWGNSVTTRVNKYYLETDLINISFPTLKVHNYMGQYPFTEEDIAALQDRFQGAIIVPEYYNQMEDSSSSSFLISCGEKTANVTLKQVLLNSLFEERIMSYDIDGSFPQTDDEIIIASDAAKELFPASCIGEKIMLHNGNGASREFTIVGVNNTVNPLNHIYTVVSAQALKPMFEEEISAQLSGIIDCSEKTESWISTGGLCGKLVSDSVGYTLEDGVLPQSENEIIISSTTAIKSFGIDWKEKAQTIYSKEYWLDLNGRWTVRVCGVFSSDELLIGCSPNLTEELKIADPVSLDVYLPDDLDTASVYKELNSEDEYFCMYYLEDLKDQIGSQTVFFEFAILISGIILTLISVAMLNSFSKITVLERRRELGIIKSLGAGNKELMAVLLYDSAVMAIASFVLSAGLTFVGNEVLKKVFGSMDYIKFSYPLTTQLLMGGVFTVIIIFCTTLHFVKVARMMPSELLTDR